MVGGQGSVDIKEQDQVSVGLYCFVSQNVSLGLAMCQSARPWRWNSKLWESTKQSETGLYFILLTQLLESVFPVIFI